MFSCSNAEINSPQDGSLAHTRSLQQEQFADSPPELDVAAYLAELAAAAGVSVEDLRFDSTLDDKVGVLLLLLLLLLLPSCCHQQW
jgi:hypothetical protein